MAVDIVAFRSAKVAVVLVSISDVSQLLNDRQFPHPTLLSRSERRLTPDP